MAQRQTKTADTAPDFEQMSAQIEQLQADIAALTENMNDTADSTRDRIKEGARAAKVVALDAGQQAEELAERGVALARANPGATLGLAAGLGFLVGFIGARAR